MASRPNATVALIDLGAHGKLADKHAAFRVFEGLSLLEWTIRRLQESTLVDMVVITGAPNLEKRVTACSLSGARWIPSAASSMLLRTCEIAERTNAQWLVFVAPTCPFTDPVLLDKLITTAWSNPESDYVGFIAPNSPKMSLARLGLVGELCSRTAIDQIRQDRLLDDQGEAAKLVRVHANPGQVRLIPLPPALEKADIQLDLAQIPDWEHAHACMEAAGEDLSWQRLASLVSSGR